MICPICGSSEIIELEIDNGICACCGGKFIMSELSCTVCGTEWKSINDNFVDYIKISQLEAYETCEVKMADYIHKCLMCDSLAYETSPTEYVCSVCNFSWEVL